MDPLNAQAGEDEGSCRASDSENLLEIEQRILGQAKPLFAALAGAQKQLSFVDAVAEFARLNEKTAISALSSCSLFKGIENPAGRLGKQILEHLNPGGAQKLGGQIASFLVQSKSIGESLTASCSVSIEMAALQEDFSALSKAVSELAASCVAEQSAFATAVHASISRAALPSYQIPGKKFQPIAQPIASKSLATPSVGASSQRRNESSAIGITQSASPEELRHEAEAGAGRPRPGLLCERRIRSERAKRLAAEARERQLWRLLRASRKEPRQEAGRDAQRKRVQWLVWLAKELVLAEFLGRLVDILLEQLSQAA